MEPCTSKTTGDRMRRIAAAAVFAAFLVCAPGSGAAQTPAGPAAKIEDKAAFTVLTLKDGLLNMSVSGIVQDSKGFLWIASQGGISRFDGRNFKSWENEPFNENSLSGDLVQTIFKDDTKGNEEVLWIGTYNGLNRFDIATERFVRYRYSVQDDNTLSNDLVIAIARDARGALWVGTLNGLNRFDEKTGSFKRYFHDDKDPHSLPNNTVRSMHLDSKGRLWIGMTGGGLASYDHDLDRFDNHTAPKAGVSGMPPSASVQAIAEDEDGRLWIGAWGLGLVRFDPANQTARVFPLPDNQTYVVNAQNADVVRVGTWGGGLHILDKATEKISSYRTSKAVGALPYDVVYSMLEDRSGELWVGTNGGGLAKMDSSRKGYTSYVADPNDPDALPKGKTLSTLVDSRGRLWASVYGAGISMLDPKTGKWRHYRNITGDPRSLPNDICNFIYEDTKGELWFCTNSGLARFDRVRGDFTVFRHRDDDADSPSSDIIYALLEDPKGNFWVGTYLSGLDYWDRSGGTWTHYPFDPKDPRSLSDNLVNFLAYDVDGRLWIATNNGLDRLEEGRFVRYYYDVKRKDGLSNNSIMRIFKDSKNILWIATRGGGILRYHPDRDNFEHFMRGDGLPSNIAYSILEDRSGDLWIVTSTGIAMYDRETGSIKRASFFSELETASFNAGSCMGPAGEIYLGAVGIITKFDPTRYETNRHIPPVFVTAIRAAGRERIATPIIEAPKANPLRLASWENSIEFRFACLDYRDSLANLYAWKLEGFDKDWTVSGTRDFATYTNLRGGRYVFRVKAANNDGIWNEEGAAIALTVDTSPFLSVPAFLVYLAAIALLGYGLATVRSNRILALKVRELTSTQAALRSASEAADRANKAKSEFIATISHEIRTPLNGVIGMTELLSRAGLDRRQSEFVSTIRNSGETLLGIINNVLDYSKIEAERVDLESIVFDPRQLVSKLKSSFSHRAESKALELVCDVSGEVPARLVGDPLRLEQVLGNLVGNAVKFTDKGTIRVGVDIEDADRGSAEAPVKRIRFRVTDTGIGIEAGILDTIFTPFTQADQSTARRFGGTGLGLSISKRMVGLMGGELRVESAPGKGSDFWFSLPLRLPSETAEVAPGIAAASQSVDAQAIDGLRILVVDDDSINRSVAVHFLLELGASADEAESGHAAIAALSKTRYDAVLMDCSMPGMDGYETTTRIRGGASLDPGTPIVAVTAYTQEEDRERCFASGMDEYLAKPISIDTLRSAVACAIAKRASGQTSAAASPLGTGRSDSEADRVGTEDFLSRYDDDRELGRKILTMFLEMAGPLFEEAKEALGRRDRSRIKAIAHRFKGSAGAVGASELVTLADGIMRLCSPDSGAGDEAVEEAMGLFEEALDRFLKRIPLIIEGWA